MSALFAYVPNARLIWVNELNFQMSSAWVLLSCALPCSIFFAYMLKQFT